MNHLSDMIWVEWRKAWRSRMPVWTSLVALILPMSIAFLIFVSKNPQISQKLGLISAKANLVAYSGADWTAFMGMFGQLAAIGCLLLTTFNVSWIFGREFADGTVKDMLAVPVQRFSILLAKFIVVAIWSFAQVLIMFLMNMVMGTVIHLPGDAFLANSQGIGPVLITGILTIVVVIPFGFFASVGRGYLLPIGVAVLTLMLTNLVAMVGWGEYFPWAIPGLYVQGKIAMGLASFLIVIFTGVAGVFVTYLWWKNADQSR